MHLPKFHVFGSPRTGIRLILSLKSETVIFDVNEMATICKRSEKTHLLEWLPEYMSKHIPDPDFIFLRQ